MLLASETSFFSQLPNSVAIGWDVKRRHGYIDERRAGALPPMSETESFMLDGVPERRDNSRLCCQIKLTAELDGIVVRLPAEQV